MNEALLWLISTALIVIGVAGTVLPAIPGTALVFGGIVLGASIDHFSRVGLGTLAVITALAIIAWILEHLAGFLGATRAGASRLALFGAVAGTIVGLFLGFVGVLFMPLVGAAIGEFIARRDRRRAVKVGFSTWLGIMVGLVAKVVIAFIMIGIFVGALWLNR